MAKTFLGGVTIAGGRASLKREQGKSEGPEGKKEKRREKRAVAQGAVRVGRAKVWFRPTRRHESAESTHHNPGRQSRAVPHREEGRGGRRNVVSDRTCAHRLCSHLCPSLPVPCTVLAREIEVAARVSRAQLWFRVRAVWGFFWPTGSCSGVPSPLVRRAGRIPNQWL